MGSALGVEKIAAHRVGLSLDAYRAKVVAGLKWCSPCRDWHQRTEFVRDRSRGDGLSARCLKSNHGSARSPRNQLHDKARHAVMAAVRYGRLPRPNTLPCADCGHVWNVGERRHEYDHHLGYAPEHKLAVHVVCTTCHADREKARRANSG